MLKRQHRFDPETAAAFIHQKMDGARGEQEYDERIEHLLEQALENARRDNIPIGEAYQAIVRSANKRHPRRASITQLQELLWIITGIFFFWFALTINMTGLCLCLLAFFLIVFTQKT